MTIAVDLGRKATKQTNKQNIFKCIFFLIAEGLTYKQVFPRKCLFKVKDNHQPEQTCLFLLSWHDCLVYPVQIHYLAIHNSEINH